MDRQFGEHFNALGLESAFAPEPEADEAALEAGRLDFGEQALLVNPLEEYEGPLGEEQAWLGEVLEAEDEAIRSSDAEWLETEWLDTSAEATPGGESVEAFAERIGREWSRRTNGEPGPEARRDRLIQDHRDTQTGAAIRRRNSGKEVTDAFVAQVTRGWMISREEQMRFETETGKGVAALGPFAPPAGRVPLIDDPLIGGSRDTVRKGKTVPGAKIAPFTLRFARALRARHGSVGMTNYHGHGGGAFNNRGYSLDLWLSATDDRGFYRQDEAIRLLRAVQAAARAVGAQWRAIYNDFLVADTINRELRRRHVIFMGTVRRNKAKQVAGLNWHGPNPLILHVHLDITPLSAAGQGEAEYEAFGDEAENEALGSDAFSGEWPSEAFEELSTEKTADEDRLTDLSERTFEDEGERWTDDRARYFEHELSETNRLLQAGDWRGAVTAAIKAGERDEAKLTNLVFFFRHPDLDRTRPLQPKRSKADAKMAQEWSRISRSEVWPAIVDFARDSILAVDGRQIAGRIIHFRGQAGKRFKQLVAAAAQKVGLNPGMIAAALIGETGTTADYLTPEKVRSYRIGVDDFYDLRNVLAKNVPAYADIRWDKNQTPVVHLNDAQKKKREVKTIHFDSGPDGLLATAVYLKYAEVRLRVDAKALGGDFDTLPIETRFALIRMSMAAGRAGAAKRLARALKSEDILVRNWAPPKIYQTERNATIRAAEAIFISGWVFGQPLTPQPPVRPQPERYGADEGENTLWEKEVFAKSENSEDLAWLAYEVGNPTPLFEEEGEEEGEWVGEETFAPEFPQAEWAEVESFDPEQTGFFAPTESEETEYFHEIPYGYPGEGLSADISALEAMLEADIGAGEAADRVKGVTTFVLGPTLRRGNSGPAVESLQRALVRIDTPVTGSGGTSPLVTDGKFGLATERAVRRFQTMSGLTPDGIVGTLTKAAIAAALGGGQVTTTVSPFSVKLYPTEMAPDAGHNARLAVALQKVRQTLPDPKRAAMLDKAAMIIVRLMPSGQMTYAGVREDEMFFSGSLLKVSLLYASFELVERVNALAPQISATSATDFFSKVGQAFDARIAAAVPQIPIGAWQKVAFDQALEAVPTGQGFTVKLSGQHRADLELIFAGQNQNIAARDCMQRLGFSFVNGNADAAGFFGVVSQKGVWMATDYSPPGRVNWPSFNIPVVTGTSSAAMTALSMANLVAQFKRGQLINPTASAEMLRIFQRGGSWLSMLANPATMSFTAIGAKVGHSASDSANVPSVKSEAALLRRKTDGAEFLTVWQNVPDTLNFAPIYDVIDEVIKTWP